MRLARLSRGHDPRFLWQVGATARGVGALFLRAFERGERVYLAMLSRGFDGAMPQAAERRPEPPPVGRRAWPPPGWPSCWPPPAGASRERCGDRTPTPDRSRRWTSAGVAFAYPDGHQALHGVDLRVEPGERVALLGPERGGQDHAGAAPQRHPARRRRQRRVGGLPVDAARPCAEIRRRVGIVFQDPDDQLFMPTVAEDVAFGPANFGVTGAALRARVDAALAAVGMLAHRDRSPQHLSVRAAPAGGGGHRAGVRPEILVLDEPSSNLDPAARRELAEILLGLRR